MFFWRTTCLSKTSTRWGRRVLGVSFGVESLFVVAGLLVFFWCGFASVFGGFLVLLIDVEVLSDDFWYSYISYISGC